MTPTPLTILGRTFDGHYLCFEVQEETEITTPELAAYLRCGEWSAARLVRTGAIEASKVAGKWLTTTDAADAYIASKSNQPTRQRRRRRAS